MQGQVLELEGVHNFRDYGGYALSGGGRLKQGWLWRSGQHHGATDRDLEQIAALGLTDIFDLRSDREREVHPCRRPALFAGQVHTPEQPTEMLAPHIASALAHKQIDVESTRTAMRHNYSLIAFRPELIGIMRHQLAVLVEGRGPSLVNCMAGKDRTGIVVALIQLALGVHRDDVMADYLLTNRAGDVEARIAAGIDTIKAVRSASALPSLDALRVIMGVEPEWLDAAFAGITQQHGSIDAYLSDVLGADNNLRGRMQDSIVE